jgi:hypothetical protein
MQTGVRTLVVVHVDRHRVAWLQPIAGNRLKTLQVGPSHVVRLAGGHPLGKLSIVVGINLPATLLLVLAADSDLHSIHWFIVGSPYRPENQGIGLGETLLLQGEIGGSSFSKTKTERCNRQNNTCDSRSSSRAQTRSSHRLPLPLLRRPPRTSPRPPPSVQWG